MARSQPAAGWLSVFWSAFLALQIGLLVPDGLSPNRAWLVAVLPLLMTPLYVATWLYLRRHAATLRLDGHV